MVKTRSQTGNITIKKEEEEDSKDNLLLKGVATATRNKITKRRPSRNNNTPLLAQQVKVEDDTDTKALLKSTSNHSKLSKRIYITQEQINKLIDYVENHNMSVAGASRMAKMSPRSGCIYYNLYKNDSEKKIPAPRRRHRRTTIYYTQEHINSLIKYINNDKMTLTKASEKANMSYQAGQYYYGKYLNDPDRSIPIAFLDRRYAQDQKSELIRYIIDDKMTIYKASKKAKINVNAGYRYCRKYFDHQNSDTATPSHIAPRRYYTQRQKKELISYIVDGKMSISAAARKVNIGPRSALGHYHQYLKDNNMKIPVSKFCNRYTQEQKKEVISYIVDDKMTAAAASRKVNINKVTARKYYRKYLKDNNLEPPVSKHRNRYSQDRINELIGYIVNDKMSINAASKKANMSKTTAGKHYRKYLNNQKRTAST